jgi:hypothetical protein
MAHYSYAACVDGVGTVLETDSIYMAGKAAGRDGGYVVRFVKGSKPATVGFFDGANVVKTQAAWSDEANVLDAIPRR